MVWLGEAGPWQVWIFQIWKLLRAEKLWCGGSPVQGAGRRGFPFCAIAREGAGGVESVKREGMFFVAATISQWDHGLNPEVQMAEGDFER